MAIHGHGGVRLVVVEQPLECAADLRHRGCSIAAHSTFARMQGGDEPLLAALASGEPLADVRLQSIRALTLALLERRGHATSELPPEAALEAIAQVAYTTPANYAADVSGVTIDPAFRDN